MHEYSRQTHTLLCTKTPCLNTTTRRTPSATARRAIKTEHKDKKKFPPKHQFPTMSSSTHFHVAIMLHSYSIYDETYGNFILREGEQ